MTNFKATYEQIDLYLQGKLEGQVLSIFEQELLTNTELGHEVELQKIVNQAVVAGYNDMLRNKITQDLDKLALRNRLKIGITSLAAITILSSILYLTLTPNQKPTKPIVESLTNNEKNPSPIIDEPTKSVILTIPKKTITTKPAFLASSVEKNKTIVLDSSEEKIPNYINNEKVNPSINESTKHLDDHVKDRIVNLCEGVQMKWNVESTASCADQDNGTINIKLHTISGGTKPYQVFINNKAVNYLAHLTAGDYEVKIIDHLGCNNTKIAKVESKVCRNNSFILNPEKGEIWSFEPSLDEIFNIAIINQSGQEVFHSKNISGKFEWNGNSSQGEILSLGFYIYLVEYNGGKKETGQITITR